MESDDKHEMESDIDRISELPGKVLQKTLSKVMIRTVVRMRRLSRKWSKVCECLQFIHLDYTDFQFWKIEKFTRFVNNLLLVRSKADLHTSQLHWDPHHPLNCNDVRMWIGYALKHNVKVLDLQLDLYDKTDLPPRIFTCCSLEELNLQWGEAPHKDYVHTALVLPDIINLPSLKRLTLLDVEVSELSLEQFVAQSPGLEDVHLINSAIYLNLIASKVLKRLTIDGFINKGNGITISAPRLISFECTGRSLRHISWKYQPSLESARVDTCGCTFDDESVFIGVLVHAKKLALLGYDIKVMLEKELPTCSVFENLITLEIGDWHLAEDFYVMLRFLQLSPRLEKLTLMHRPIDREAEGEEASGMPIDGMTFHCPFLECVTIQCSKGDDGIDKLVNVLVVNGISLDKINIAFHEDIKKRALDDKVRAREERSKELAIFEKRAKARESREWIDDDPYAPSDPDSEESDPYSEESDPYSDGF